MTDRNRVSGPLLSLTALLLALLAVEGFLRLNMDPSDLYGNFPGNPASIERLNEVKFWERYREDPDASFGSHDPILGWDRQPGDERFRKGPNPNKRDGVRMVAVGDSFVYGNEVTARENFSAILEQEYPELQVFNMGVPGYGIDQSYLKYQHFGAQLEPDVVLFGIFVPDYERASLAFTAFAKPRFEDRNGEIALTNVPVPHPKLELERIGAQQSGQWYLPRMLGNVWHKVRTRGEPEDDFFEVTDRVVGHLLQSLEAAMAPDQRLLIIHIPRGENLLEPDSFHDRMSRHLLDIYAREGLQFIDLAKAFSAEIGSEEAIRRYYMPRPHGGTGHLSPAGHRRLAALIAQRL